MMNKKQIQNRIDAILKISEGCVKVLWGHVIERGVGLNFRVHGVHTTFQGPEETARALMPVNRNNGPLFGGD